MSPKIFEHSLMPLIATMRNPTTRQRKQLSRQCSHMPSLPITSSIHPPRKFEFIFGYSALREHLTPAHCGLVALLRLQPTVSTLARTRPELLRPPKPVPTRPQFRFCIPAVLSLTHEFISFLKSQFQVAWNEATFITIWRMGRPNSCDGTYS